MYININMSCLKSNFNTGNLFCIAGIILYTYYLFLDLRKAFENVWKYLNDFGIVDLKRLTTLFHP